MENAQLNERANYTKLIDEWDLAVVDYTASIVRLLR